MKDYLNAEERANLIALIALKQTTEKFVKKTCLTDKERHYLNKVIEWSDKFKDEILERMGDVLRRKIVNTMKLNEISLVSKYGMGGKAPISEAATEDLKPAISELHLFHCNGCTKCNYKDCAVYAISVACDVEENNANDGCPFKISSLNFNEMEDEDEF